VLNGAVDMATAPPFPHAHHWWARVVGDSVELRAPNSTYLVAPVQRMTHVAAGTALFAARLAVAAAGVRPFTTLVPDPHRPGLLAVLRLGPESEPTRAERALHRALVRPETPRLGRLVGPALPLLRRAADAEGAWLRR
jgi:hypothetical protein